MLILVATDSELILATMSLMMLVFRNLHMIRSGMYSSILGLYDAAILISSADTL